MTAEAPKKGVKPSRVKTLAGVYNSLNMNQNFCSKCFHFGLSHLSFNLDKNIFIFKHETLFLF